MVLVHSITHTLLPVRGASLSHGREFEQWLAGWLQWFSCRYYIATNSMYNTASRGSVGHFFLRRWEQRCSINVSIIVQHLANGMQLVGFWRAVVAAEAMGDGRWKLCELLVDERSIVRTCSAGPGIKKN